MKDNRVASRYNELWAAATKEMKYVVDIPDHLWSKLAQASSSLTPTKLKDRVISGAHVSYHFLWRRVLKPAGDLPWRLCRGDVDHNLDCLAAMEEPAEPCSRNLWHLLQGPFPKAQLRGVVKLLGECSWSSMPAEQQHASVALLHRWHPEYGMDQLISRALLHQTVRLLPHVSKADKQIARLLHRMERVDARTPQRVTGSHMLVQALVHVAKGRKDTKNTFPFCVCFMCAPFVVREVVSSPSVQGQVCKGM